MGLKNGTFSPTVAYNATGAQAWTGPARVFFAGARPLRAPGSNASQWQRQTESEQDVTANATLCDIFKRRYKQYRPFKFLH